MRLPIKFRRPRHNLPAPRPQIQAQMEFRRRNQRPPRKCPQLLLHRHSTFAGTSRSIEILTPSGLLNKLPFVICWVHAVDAQLYLGIGDTFLPTMDLGCRCLLRFSKPSQTSTTTPRDLVLSTQPSCSICSRSAVLLTKPQILL